MTRKIKPEQMLRQVQNLGVVSQRFEILFRFAVFELANLSLRETKPSSEQLLIERLPEQLNVAKVISVYLEDSADMLTLERRSKFVGLEEFIP